MPSAPLVSVIVPSYNHELYVKQTIDSILEQDYPNIELLILDDGSRDNTYQILTQLKPTCEKRFKRVLLQKQVNQGTARTLSNLVAQCQGKYILVCASDDLLVSNCISQQVKVLEENPTFVQTLPDNYFIDANGLPLERSRNQDDTYYALGTQKGNFHTFASFWKAAMQGTDLNINNFHTYASLLKKHCFLNGSLWRTDVARNFFPLPTIRPLAEDWYINLQFSKFGKVQFIDIPLFKYRIHHKQTIANLPLLQKNDENLFLAELAQISKPGQEKWKKICHQVWFTPQTIKKGVRFLYLERLTCFVSSQRNLVIFGVKIHLHTRYKHKVPDWYIYPQS